VRIYVTSRRITTFKTGSFRVTDTSNFTHSLDSYYTGNKHSLLCTHFNVRNRPREKNRGEGERKEQ